MNRLFGLADGGDHCFELLSILPRLFADFGDRADEGLMRAGTGLWRVDDFNLAGSGDGDGFHARNREFFLSSRKAWPSMSILR